MNLEELNDCIRHTDRRIKCKQNVSSFLGKMRTIGIFKKNTLEAYFNSCGETKTYVEKVTKNCCRFSLGYCENAICIHKGG